MKKKRIRNVKAGHMVGMEILIETRESVELSKIHPEMRVLVKAHEEIIKSLFDVHGQGKIIYAPYGDYKYKGMLNPSFGVEIQIHKCCGVDGEELRKLNKIYNFGSSEYPQKDVKIEACYDKEHYRYSKTLGETFMCTKITIDVDFHKY